MDAERKEPQLLKKKESLQVDLNYSLVLKGKNFLFLEELEKVAFVCLLDRNR